MNVIVTGGAGFIGSHLCELLVKKPEIKKIIALDYLLDGSLKNLKSIKSSKKFKFVKADINNYKKIIKYFKNIDYVFHLAAMSDIVPSITDPRDYMNTNIIGTMNVLEAMRKNHVKNIIYAASSSCYGIPKKFPTKENEKIDTRYPYAFSKNIGEQTIIHWSKVYKINYISLRLFNVYGTRSRTHGAYGAALGVFLKQKISNKPLTIVGNGKQTRDFINVVDVANAFYKAMKMKKNNLIFNIGFGKPNSINFLASLISKKFVNIPKRPGEPDCTHANILHAKKILRWKPQISLKNGMKNLLQDIAYWNNATLWTPKKIKKATKNWFKYLK